MIKDLIRQGVDIEVKDEQVAVDNLLLVFTTKPHVANSKCMQISWLFAFYTGLKSKKMKDKFCTDLIFLASKECERYGPFGKIY